ncbi:MAG: SDR family oxidoreductase [Candidatus Aenigmatarchaeota archaeon]
MTDRKVAIITGANRGIGFETARQLAKLGIKVILTARDEKKGKDACNILKKEGLDVIFHQLDVTDNKSVENMYEYALKEFEKIDILINNAGISIDTDNDIISVDIEKIRKTMETNLYGPLLLSQKFIPLMRKNGYGRIINISSTMGQMNSYELRSPFPQGTRSSGYRISKTALNMLTRILAHEVKGSNILVNSVCPGWLKTDMGGPDATRKVEEGVETIIWLATLPDNGPTGRFFENGNIIRW